jgi:hypothetical protein
MISTKPSAFELTGAQKGDQRNQNRHGNQCPNESFIAGRFWKKRLMAFMSMLLALDNGFQACLMANKKY